MSVGKRPNICGGKLRTALLLVNDFRYCCTPLDGVLCTFRSLYLCIIGHQRWVALLSLEYTRDHLATCSSCSTHTALKVTRHSPPHPFHCAPRRDDLPFHHNTLYGKRGGDLRQRTLTTCRTAAIPSLNGGISSLSTRSEQRATSPQGTAVERGRSHCETSQQSSIVGLPIERCLSPLSKQGGLHNSRERDTESVRSPISLAVTTRETVVLLSCPER